MGKYTLELGDPAHKDKLTFYAGYSHIEKGHADYTVGSAQGNYQLNVGININDAAVYNMEWLGGADMRMSSRLELHRARCITSLRTAGPSGWEARVRTNIGCAAAGLLCAGIQERHRSSWTTSSTSTTTCMAA